MKKIILTLIIVFFTICNHAQEIKIKKGEVLLDGNAIAKIESKVREYKISNLDGSNAIIASIKVGNPFAFIELKNEVTDKSNEMDFAKYSPFNIDRSIIQTLFSKGLMTAKGIDIEKVNAFLDEPQTGLSEKYGYVKPEIIEAANKVADTYQLSIDDMGVIYSIKAQNPDPLDKKIGYIKVTSPSTNGELMYQVTDLDGYLIAEWFAKSGLVSGYSKFLNQELFTFDKKVFKAVFDNRGNPIGYKMSKDITAMNIVRVLVGNGYVLQHQSAATATVKRMEQAQNTANKIKEARKESNNLYEQNGYVINEKGEKRTGPITAEFESIKVESSGGMSDMTAYGKTVTLKYTNEKGRGKTEIYKSKNGIRFCIDKDGQEECYLGLKTIGNTMAAAGSLNSLSFDFSSFYKILYENDGYLVLVDPSLDSDFIIKIPNQEKGLYTNKSSVDKLKKNITEYFKCDSFVFENYDFKALEGLIKVLEDYKNNCKK